MKSGKWKVESEEGKVDREKCRGKSDKWRVKSEVRPFGIIAYIVIAI